MLLWTLTIFEKYCQNGPISTRGAVSSFWEKNLDGTLTEQVVYWNTWTISKGVENLILSALRSLLNPLNIKKIPEYAHSSTLHSIVSASTKCRISMRQFC